MNSQNSTQIEPDRLRQASEWVQRLADPAETGEVFLQWQKWCEAHPDNARTFVQMQEVWEGFSPVRLARVRTYDRPTRPRFAMVAAATVLAVLATAAVAWLRSNAADTEEWRTGIGEIRHAVLTDGSRLDLGADSRVLVHYSAEERSLRLIEGRAYFSVARDAIRPFIVHAGGLKVTAVGTAFDIRTTPDNTVITVGEGRVKIAAQDPPSWDTARSIEPLLADAGRRVRYSELTQALTVARVDPQLTDSWRLGVLQFQEEPLHEVVSEVNRYSTRPIVLDDPALGQALFTGTISRHRVGDWFVALEEILPVTVEDLGAEGYRIVRRPAAAAGR